MHRSYQLMRNQIQDTLDSIDIEEFIDSYGLDYRTVASSNGLQANIKTCPSCGNDNYKCYINLETGLGKCHSGSCDMGGFNLWIFMEKVGNCTNYKATKSFIGRVAASQGWRPAKKRAPAKLDFGALNMPPMVDIKRGSVVEDYLNKRGFRKETINHFNLKFCEKGGIEEISPIDGSVHFKDFSQRVIFPILDYDGNLVNYQGRSITGKQPKYLNPTGHALSGTHLYNVNNGHGAQEIVLVEGVTDVAKTHQHFMEENEFRNVLVLGTFGMSLGEEQIEILRKLCDEGGNMITVMWDSERAAVRSMVEACKVLQHLNIRSRMALLPDGVDPGSAKKKQLIQAYYNRINPSSIQGLKRLVNYLL